MGTDLIKAADFGLVALDPSSEVAEILGEALAGESVGLGDMERVKWPSGGATRFEREVMGNSESGDSIVGVIVHQRMSRSYWSTPDPIAGQQPDCISPDAKWGYGNPGDELRSQNPPKGCEVCPMAQFGSAPPRRDGTPQRGQACKLMRDMFILTPGATFPTIVSVPPGSLGEAKGYLVDLAGHQIRHWTVVTELALEKAQSRDGQPYAKARFKMAGRLDPETVEQVRSYREQMLPSLTATRAAEAPIAEVVDAD